MTYRKIGQIVSSADAIIGLAERLDISCDVLLVDALVANRMKPAITRRAV
jgi:hypothetical protein